MSQLHEEFDKLNGIKLPANIKSKIIKNNPFYG